MSLLNDLLSSTNSMNQVKDNVGARSGIGMCVGTKGTGVCDYSDYDEYEIGNHRFSKGRYLYNNDYEVKLVDFHGFGQNGRIYKMHSYGVDVYYLCVSNSAVDWDDWHFGDALIPIVFDTENNTIDIAKTCNKKCIEDILKGSSTSYHHITGDENLLYPLILSLDLSFCEPTEFMVCEADMNEFKESCWFRDVAFDYEEEGTRIDSFVIDHEIPYAEHHPECKDIRVYVVDIPYEITWAGMIDRFNKEGRDKLRRH